MKFVIAVNRKADLAAQFNAAGHVSLGMPSLIDLCALRLREFRDNTERRLSVLTDFPLIILSARSGEHIREAHSLAEQRGVICNAFFEPMRAGTPEEQEQKIRTTSANDLDYIALGLFGPTEDLRVITRRFSLFRAPDLFQ